MKKAKGKRGGKREIFLLVGYIPIVPSGPSLGTPVFRLPDAEGEYVQFSHKEKTIEHLVRLPYAVSHLESFVQLSPNNIFEPQNEFLIGFRDLGGYSHVYPKSDLRDKILREFSDYDHLPYLQWNLINCFDAHNLISKLSHANIQKICRAYVGDVLFDHGKRDETKLLIRTDVAPGTLSDWVKHYFDVASSYTFHYRDIFERINRNHIVATRPAEALKLIENFESDHFIRFNPEVFILADDLRLSSKEMRSKKTMGAVLRSIQESLLRSVLSHKTQSLRARKRGSRIALDRSYAPKGARRESARGPNK